MCAIIMLMSADLAKTIQKIALMVGRRGHIRDETTVLICDSKGDVKLREAMPNI